MIANHAQHVRARSRRTPGRRRGGGPFRPRWRSDSPVMIAVMAPVKARASSRVVGQTAQHQHRADVGVAEAERAVVVGEAGDFLARELRHQHADLEHDRPEPDRVAIALDIELAGLHVEELDAGSD